VQGNKKVTARKSLIRPGTALGDIARRVRGLLPSKHACVSGRGGYKGEYKDGWEGRWVLESMGWD